MAMNPTIAGALKKLLGDTEFADELRSLLDNANSTDEVARAGDPTESEQAAADKAAPAAEEIAPDVAKEIVVDEKLMGQIVSALTADDTFMDKLTIKVGELLKEDAPEIPEPAMTEEMGEEIKQALQELQRGVNEVLAEEGNKTTRARSTTPDLSSSKKTMADKAGKTLAKLGK